MRTFTSWLENSRAQRSFWHVYLGFKGNWESYTRLRCVFSCRSPFPLPSLLPLFRRALKLLMDLIQHCSRSFLITKSCHMRKLLREEKTLTSSSNAKHSVLVFSLGMVTLPKSNCFTIRIFAACSFSFSYLAVQRPSVTPSKPINAHLSSNIA